MKKYKKRIALIVILTYILTATASGCDFVVKDTPVNIDSMYYTEDKETPDIGTDAEETKSEVSSDSSDINLTHKNERDTSSDSESKAENAEKDNKTSSSKSASSKPKESNTSSKNTSSESEVKVTGISLDIHELTLEIGQSKMPVVTMTPANAVNKGEIWKSSDEKVATVDRNGIIRAVAEGKCVVTVTAAGNSSVNSKVNVTVKSKPKVESISLSFNEATIKVGETVMPQVTMLPLNADTLEEKWTSSNDKVAEVDAYGNITGRSEGTCKINVASVSNPKVSKDITVTVKRNDNENSDIETTESGETYIDGMIIVNKTYGLPSDYNPGGLTSECSEHFERLRSAAADDGINIYISSGFRSYEEQQQLYNSYVDYYGKEYAETFSARPGHSEHQTGLAIDCNIVNDSFIGTPEAEWLAEHCYEYGFIIRYPKDKESITGYKYEPWHIRYVGEEMAEVIYNSELTLEEYFGIDSVYND